MPNLMFALLSTIALPQSANAVRKRNDELCNTGFFTNIAQWYCTEFGDISDEGVGKELSESQESATDSLMTKFSLDSSNISTEMTALSSSDKLKEDKKNIIDDISKLNQNPK